MWASAEQACALVMKAVLNAKHGGIAARWEGMGCILAKGKAGQSSEMGLLAYNTSVIFLLKGVERWR